MVYFPNEIWREIYSFDNTFLENFRMHVLKELKIHFTKEIAELFFYFFWDTSYIHNICFYEKNFRFQTKDKNIWHTIEFKEFDNDFIFRIHNEKTGKWHDEIL